MKRVNAFFKASIGELKNVRSLVMASLLTAIYAVSYSPFAGNIVIVPGLMEFRFGFLAIGLAAALFGPVVGMLVALLGDFVGTILFYGGSFFFGYTLSWTLMGLVFGCFLYKERLTLPRMIGAMTVNTVLINQILTTTWQYLMGFGAFWPLFISRLPRNAIMLPVNTILLVLVLRGVTAAYHRIVRAA